MRLQNERCAETTSVNAAHSMLRSHWQSFPPERAQPSNENKMSDGGRARGLLGLEMRKSSQNWSVQRSVVRSIAWLDGGRGFTRREELTNSDDERQSL